MEEFMLPCLNKSLTGVDCFGCGGQRALLLVFKAEFSQAFYMFPGIYPILILLAFLIVNLFGLFVLEGVFAIRFLLKHLCFDQEG